MSERKTRTRITIDVIDKDIERAKRNDSYLCVVMQAIARTIPDATRIEVDTQTIRFTTEGERRIYLTPYAVQGYVVAFDAGDPIEPFSFQLRDPKRVARKTRTPTGKAANRSAQAARRRAHVGTSAEVPTQADESPSATYAAVARQAREPLTQSDRGGPKAPPRVFKTKRRSYGHRLLRINHEVVE